MGRKKFSLLPPKKKPKKAYTARRTMGISFKPKHLDYTIPILKKFRQIEERSKLIRQLLDDEFARVPKAELEAIAKTLNLLPDAPGIAQEVAIEPVAALSA